MLKILFRAAIACALIATVVSCKDQAFSDEIKNVDKVSVDHLTPEMMKVRDYVPAFAVMAHRGSTFWTPEETEAAYRWAREMGADYLECDMQVSKDGVVLALHDDNLTRTTNIATVFGEEIPPMRKAYYMKLGYSEAEAEAKFQADKAAFIPNLPAFYTFEELQMLDAGKWFNNAYPNQARRGFVTQKQYISALKDLVMYSRGMKLKRNPDGSRVCAIVGKTGKQITSLSGTADIVEYNLEYEQDNVDSGNRPGIYIEFKEPWLNPTGFEQIVYDELDALGMNIITQPEPESNPHYLDGKVNINNTNGKVVLQTFSLQSLVQVSEIFEGKVPMCFLLWKGTGATDMTYDDPLGYASFINLGVKYKAHIIGPCIAGAPNNYPDLNKPWQVDLIHRAGMLDHPYSFDSRDQMSIAWGDYNFGNTGGVLFNPPYLDGAFTNRSEMTLDFFISKGVRPSPAPQVVPNPSELLTQLGYEE